MESNSICNHQEKNRTSAQRVSDLLIALNDTKSYHQYITKITISEKWRIAKGKSALKYWQRRRELFHVSLKLRLADFNYTFECDWLIYSTTVNVIGLLNCPITNCQIRTWQENKRKIGVFKPITIEEIAFFMINCTASGKSGPHHYNLWRFS